MLEEKTESKEKMYNKTAKHNKVEHFKLAENSSNPRKEKEKPTDKLNNQKDQRNDSNRSELKTNNQKTNHFRKISKDKYIIAGVLTFLIFSLGLTLGVILEEERYNWAEEINQEQDVEYLSLQLQYLFLSNLPSSNAQDSCAILTASLQDSVSDLSTSLARIVDYEEANTLSDEEIILLKRRYTLDNIRYWLLAGEAKEKCEMQMTTILYFYTEGCQDCASQGTVLSYYKALLEDSFLVFPIDQTLVSEEPLVQILLSLYNVEDLPTLVIDGELYPGFVSKEDLNELICMEQPNLDLCT